MNNKNKSKTTGHTLGAFLLLPFSWFFILMIILEFIYPFLTMTTGMERAYAIGAVMLLFAFIAPFVHNFFYQINYGMMASLWVLFTVIGFFRLNESVQSHYQILFHMLSWQLPAVVFSLIYTLLYSNNKALEMEAADS